MSTRQPAVPTSDRLRALDALRFICALAVVLYHFTARPHPGPLGDPLEHWPALSGVMKYGAMGPHIFFLISGFVILMSAWNRSVTAFTASRIARLYPAYWVAVILTGALILFVRPASSELDGQLGLKEVLVNLSMLQTAFGVKDVDGAYWTLFVELKFYVLIAVLLAVGMTRRRVIAFALLWPAVGLLALRLNLPVLPVVLEPTYAPLFAIGMMLFLTYREGPRVSTFAVLVVNLTLAMSLSATYAQPIETVTGRETSALVVGLIVVCGVLAIVATAMTPLARLDWQWLSIAGALTYPVYLVHEKIGWWIIGLLSDAGLSPWATIGVALVLILLLGGIIYYVVEKPFAGQFRRAVRKGLEALPLPQSWKSGQMPNQSQRSVESLPR